jgi:hypothetical protein
MPLPETRDLTLNPGDPVPSALLNRLQDMIADAKHPLLTIPIPARALQPGNSKVVMDAAGYWRADGDPGLLYYPLQIPAGTTLARIDIYGHDANNAHFRAEILAKNLTTTAPESPLVSPKSSPGTGAPTSIALTESLPNMPITPNAHTTYTLSIGLDPDPSVRIYGVALTVSRL